MGLNRIDHAAILVEDLGAALEWYEGVLGLDVLDRANRHAHLSCGSDHADITLITGDRPHGPVSFAMGVDSPDDLEQLERRLDDNGVSYERVAEPERPGTGQVSRFRLPTGHVMEMAVGAGDRVAGIIDYTWDGESHRPTDLDHINLLGAASPKDVAQFLCDVVGFRLSLSIQAGPEWLAMWSRATRIDHDVAYMRAVRDGDTLHHVAFTMVDSNHYQRLGDRLAVTGNRFEFGPGRHGGSGPGRADGFGTNLFAYAFDPAGNRNEFSADMKEYDDDAPPSKLDGTTNIPEMMNLWATNMPESFMTVGS